MAKAQRPLSPHLQIYGWYFSMALSIAHRASGVVLSLALVLLTWWLVALASGGESFAIVDTVADSWFGGLILFCLTFVLFYHMANGIRHLAWDIGFGFEKHQAKATGIAVLAAAGVLTFITWIVILTT